MNLPVTDDFQGHLGIAGVAVMALEYAKKSNLPIFRWIDAEKAHLAKWISMGVAVLSTIGFQFQYDGLNIWDVLTDGGNITLHVPMGLLENSLDMLVRGVSQYLMQQATYHTLVKPASNQ